MTLTIKWRRRLKTTVEYKTTSTGPRYHLPILEMLHVLFWDDRQLGVLSIWRNISTGDMQTCLSQFSTWFSHLQNSIIISKRCQWERMSWPMGDQHTESTSSLQTGRNQGLTTPMNSGSRTENCCWRKQNKHCLSLERVPPKIPTAIVFPLATHGSYDKDNPQGQTGLKEEIINLPFLSEWCPRGIST